MFINTKLDDKSCHDLSIINMKKTSQKVETYTVLKACILFVICTRVTTLCYTTNALVFSKSEAYNFFMYIITLINFYKIPRLSSHNFYMVGIRITSMSEAMSHSFTLTELKKILTGHSQQSVQNFGLIPLFHGICDMSWKPTHPACRIWQL